jgi:hypothetical protein
MYNTVFIWKYLGVGSAKKSGIPARAVIHFSLGTENQTHLQWSAKKPGKELVIFAYE